MVSRPRVQKFKKHHTSISKRFLYSKRYFLQESSFYHFYLKTSGLSRTLCLKLRRISHQRSCTCKQIHRKINLLSSSQSRQAISSWALTFLNDIVQSLFGIEIRFLQEFLQRIPLQSWLSQCKPESKLLQP